MGVVVLIEGVNLGILTDKPPLMDLQYFLDFSGPRTWAPIHNDLPFGAAPNMASAYPALHINFMGPKLYVNTTPVRIYFTSLVLACIFFSSFTKSLTLLTNYR